MRLLRMLIATGLLVGGLELLIVRTEAVAANPCPCKQVGNSCIRDRLCEQQLYRSGTATYKERTYKNRGAIGSSPARSENPATRTGYRRLEVRPPPADALRRPSAGPVNPAPQDVPAPNVGSRPPPAANGRSPASVPTGSERAAPTIARPRILETGYSHLTEFGKETPGYGLYSYAILPSGSDRATRFLAEVFREIPAIGDTSAKPSQLNIFYVPLRKEKEADLTTMRETLGHDAAKRGAEYTKSFYDYRMARGLLNHICNPPDPSVLDLCNGDLSRGPYIFTYASPASHIEPVPPPYLFVDLSDVHERAFGEFLAAFQAQVKRDDITDQARIQTLRLRVLNIALTAADWVGPVQKAVADIARSASGGDDKK